MNNIAIANQTIKIVKDGKYMLGDREVLFPAVKTDSVIVISPEDGKTYLEKGISSLMRDEMCRINVVNADSFQAGRMYKNPLVMNFANAHNPGGGFLLGANAQEEALCRCSSLYMSITSSAASEMYRYNNLHPGRVESDYMLISPEVVVFRDEKYELLEEPVTMAVVTVPAPNRFGAALLASNKLIEETFIRRIRIMLAAAANYGYRDIILGAWGCGAFGNKPEDVSEYFRRVIIDDKYGYCFENICFAIYGAEDGKNITAFRKCFG